MPKNWLSFIWITKKTTRNLTGYNKVYKRPQWITSAWPNPTEQANNFPDKKRFEVKFNLHLRQTADKVLFHYCRNQKYLHQFIEIVVHLCRTCTINWKGKQLNLPLILTATLPYWARRKYLMIAKGFVCRRGREHYRPKNNRISS